MEEKKSPLKLIYEQIHATAEAAGMKVLSDEHCCKLLAWLYVFGGGDEKVTLDYKLNTDIRAAQRRLNLDGGETPNVELLPMLKSYIKEIAPFIRGNDEQITHPDWVQEICKYYGVTVR